IRRRESVRRPEARRRVQPAPIRRARPAPTVRPASRRRIPAAPRAELPTAAPVLLAVSPSRCTAPVNPVRHASANISPAFESDGRSARLALGAQSICPHPNERHQADCCERKAGSGVRLFGRAGGGGGAGGGAGGGRAGGGGGRGRS